MPSFDAFSVVFCLWFIVCLAVVLFAPIGENGRFWRARRGSNPGRRIESPRTAPAARPLPFTLP